MPFFRSGVLLNRLVPEGVPRLGAPPAGVLPSAPCDVRALAGLPLILLPRPAGSRMRLDRAAAEAGIQLDVRHEVANVDVVKDFVGRGIGFGLLPHSSVMQGVADGHYRAVPVEGISITRTLVRRADRPLAPAVRELARLVHEEIGRMNAAGMFGAAPG